VAALDLSPQDDVVEIGAGHGVLTRAIARQARSVTALEVDAKLADELQTAFASTANVTIIHADALDLDPCDLVCDSTRPGSRKLAGNIPYYITGALIRHYLGSTCRPRLAVLMVQLEVARRMLAGPGSMSMLALSIQVYGKPSLVTKVGRGAFRPPPKVESAVVKLEIFDSPRIAADREEAFFAVARAGFSTRRKQLVNALALGLRTSKDRTAAILAAADVAPNRRAEELSIDEWSALADARGMLDPTARSVDRPAPSDFQYAPPRTLGALYLEAEPSNTKNRKPTE
jgi:16S rRNA (adenine1518-N6/adenine1519-N6)-dimethyltransferase